MILDVLRAQPIWICLFVFALRPCLTIQNSLPPLPTAGIQRRSTESDHPCVEMGCSQLLCVLLCATREARRAVVVLAGASEKTDGSPATQLQALTLNAKSVL